MSHPARMRELKCFHIFLSHPLSHPTLMCELKNGQCTRYAKYQYRRILRGCGNWNTLCDGSAARCNPSHPYGCENWNLLSYVHGYMSYPTRIRELKCQVLFDWARSRILRGCGNWNTGCYKCPIEFYASHPVWDAGIEIQNSWYKLGTSQEGMWIEIRRAYCNGNCNWIVASMHGAGIEIDKQPAPDA